MLKDRDIERRLKECWKAVELNSVSTDSEFFRSLIFETIEALDHGIIRIVKKNSEKPKGYSVNEHIKRAITAFFKLSKISLMNFGDMLCFDKIPLKTAGWTEKDFKNTGFRAAPGAIIRRSAYVAPNVVVMQSFVNVGAYVDEGTMLDSHSLVGSCAQVGKHCHISAGAILGGVLEPLQATPVIVEDECFIGAGSSITEGVIVERGAVIASGVNITASTRIVDRVSGEIVYGRVPEYSVVVPGTYSVDNSYGSGKVSGNVNLACAVIVKKYDFQIRDKTSVNELLRL